MTVRINIDGTITSTADARISVLDRGFLYGDSIYEVVRTYEGVVFALEEHLTRLEIKVDGHTTRLTKIEKACNNGVMGSMDLKMVLKWGAGILFLIAAGSAGGDAAREVIKMIFAM